MAEKLKRCKPEFGHGFAGLASNFIDLGHRKLKTGGVLALVVPFTIAQGGAWEKTRKALCANYADIHVLSIATTGSTQRAFSADTSMAECLVVATKRAEGNGGALFCNLDARPAFLLEAAITAKNARERVAQGNILNAGAAGVRSSDVIKAAENLQEGHLLLPRRTQPVAVPVVSLGTVAKPGLNDSDISRRPPSNAPFDIRAIRKAEVPTYPALWNHDAAREQQLIVQPDACCDVRNGFDEKATVVWSRTASRLHANRDFRLNSQSLAMCLTPEECLGGRSWPNVIPHKSGYEIPLLLWANSTPGLILFWWYGTRQQLGRSVTTVSKLPGLPVLDPRTLTNGQLDLLRRNLR